MAVYLLSWNPTRWDWRNIKEQSEQLARGAPVIRQWSCGTNRRIFNGDIVYFIRQGREPRGIFARGEVVRGSHEVMNVDVQDANRGRGTLVVDVRFTGLLNAVERVALGMPQLKSGALGRFVWEIRESGVRVPDAIAAELERSWQAATGAAPVAREQAASVSPPGKVKEEAAPLEQPAPAAPASDEQERLRREREARLQKIRQRELEERRRRETAAQSAAPAPAVPPDAERRNEILVQNYFIMLDAELRGELYSKADHRNRILMELGNAAPEDVDTAHRHISAVLAETGLPFADGFPPQSGFDPRLEKAVHVFIEANPELVEALWLDTVPAAASIPVELDDSKAHWVPVPEPSGYRPSTRAAWHPGGVNEIDYRVREAWNRNLANAGERFVLAFERARLREAGLKDFVDKVAWESQTFGESFGYDVRSLDADGKERYICVKTTNYGARFPFVMTAREIERARELGKHFFVYRVFQFSRGAKLFMLPAERLLQETLEPVAFRSWI